MSMLRGKGVVRLMGFLTSLLGGGAASGAGALMEGAGSLAKDLRTAITGELDPDKRASLEAKALEIEAQIKHGQMRINEQESKHASIFVAGWRPGVGWTCVTGLYYQLIIHPLISWSCAMFLPGVTPPAMETGLLVTILGGILGLGAMRSYEKKNEVDDRH